MKFGSQAEYAAHRGVSENYVSKLKRAGRLVLVQQDGKAKVDFVRTDRLIANTADQSRAHMGANSPPATPRQPAFPPLAQPEAEQPAEAVSGGDAPSSGIGAVAQPDEFRRAQTQERVFAAKRAELEYLRLTGAVLDKAAVQREVFDAFRVLRDQAMQAPERAAPRCVVLRDPAEIERVMLDELRKAFERWEADMLRRLEPKVAA